MISPGRYHYRNAILTGREDAGWEQFIPRNQTSRSLADVAIESGLLQPMETSNVEPRREERVAGEDGVGSGDDFPVGITGSTHTVVCDEEEGGVDLWLKERPMIWKVAMCAVSSGVEKSHGAVDNERLAPVVRQVTDRGGLFLSHRTPVDA
ncbi:hypothetical protein BHM03_00061909 [Ensete ventricosum]|nr:hypothetical protein BHM03_00061909 [Ensete ventricosum]